MKKMTLQDVIFETKYYNKNGNPCYRIFNRDLLKKDASPLFRRSKKGVSFQSFNLSETLEELYKEGYIKPPYTIVNE